MPLAYKRESDGVMVKECTRCTETKEVTAYGKGCNSDGLQSQCRDCGREATRLRKAGLEYRHPRKSKHRCYEQDGEMVKLCSRCDKVKPIAQYHVHRRPERPNHDGYRPHCRECEYERRRQYKDCDWMKAGKHRHYIKHKARYQAYSKEWRQREGSKERLKECYIKRNSDPAYKAQLNENARIARQQPEAKEKRRQYQREQRRTNPSYRLEENLRRQINDAISGGRKSGRSFQMIGCTIDAARQHLEDQWVEGMNWTNYGGRVSRTRWNIDHIVCLELFDIHDTAHQDACFHYTNLRPMWSSENSAKSDRLPDGRYARNLSQAEKREVLIKLGFAHLFAEPEVDGSGI